MKRTVVFLLFFLLLVVSVSGTAFAEKGNWSPPTPEVAVLVCQPSSTGTFTVYAFSNTVTSVTISPGEDCGNALMNLEGVPLQIKDIKVLNTTPTPSVVYTLGNVK